MSEQQFAPAIRTARAWEALVCTAISALGVTVVFGWLVHSRALVTIFPGYIPMVFDAGAAFFLAGISLWLLHKPGAAAGAVRAAIGVVLVLLSCGVLFEPWLGGSLGIDLPQLHAWYDYGDLQPGRMAPNTAMSFALIGAAVLLTDRATTKSGVVVIVILNFSILGLGLTGLAGYFLAPDLLFEWTRSARMAVPTATGIILCAIALRMTWSKTDWYASQKYFREDEKILLLGPGILMVVTISAGLSGFVLQQNALQSVLVNKLEAMRRERVILFSTSVERANQHAMSAMRTARLEDAGRAYLAAADSHASVDAVNASAATALALDGLRGITLLDAGGVPGHSYGKPSSNPSMTASLNLDGSQALLWDGELVLRVRIPLTQNGKFLGSIVTDQSLDYLSGPLFDTEDLGNSGEVAVCALPAARPRCFPGSHHANPWMPSLRASESQLLPVQHALVGENGHMLAVDYRGKNVMATYGGLTLTLGIVIKQDTAELFAVIRNALLFGVPFIVAIALFGAVLLYSQLKPLAARMLASEAKANEREQQIRTVVGSVGEGILTIDDEGLIREVNPAAGEIFGYQAEELIGQNARLLIMPKNRRAGYGSLNQDLHGWVAAIAGQRNIKISGQKKDGSELPLEVTINEMRLSGRRMFVGVLRDITERNEVERKLTALGQYDSLTGLPNRLLFTDRLNLAVLRMQRTHRAVAVMFLDLDGFKEVNDTYGHQGGDELLVQVARRLSATVRNTDTVARLAGDEFTVILEGLTDPETGAIAMAQKIIAAMQKPYSVAGREITVTASVGVAVHKSGDLETADLLARADRAMYTAKRAGNNRMSVA
ncbi:MAG: diguanylate cyclase [Gammaproteobacteria bacterium]